MIWILAAVAGTPSVPEDRTSMQVHWVHAEQARDAVVQGDLEAVKAAVAAWQAVKAPKDGIRAQARDALKDSFGELGKAEDLAAAATRLASMARECGGCHTAADSTSHSWVPATPGEGEMGLHREGLAWMWAGIVGAQPPLFEKGVRTLAAGNRVPSGLPAGTTNQKIADTLEIRVQDLAQRAQREHDVNKRAVIFGDILTTCAACHRVTGGGPK